MRPTWLVDSLAGVMVLTAAYCIGRLVAARLWDRTTHLDVDVAHVAMGVGMAGMLVPSLRSLPTGIWEVVFAAMAVWFTVQIVHFVLRWGVRGLDEDHLHHASHYVTHLAMVVAMIYMFAALPMAGTEVMGSTSTSTMGSSTSGVTGSGLSFVFAFVLLVAAVWYADGLTRFTRARPESVAAGVFVGDPGTPAPSAATAAERDGGVVAVRRRLAFSGVTVLCARDSRWLAPRLEIATHIGMCFTMGYMLIAMR